MNDFMHNNENEFENLRASDFKKKDSYEINKIDTKQKNYESGADEGNKQKELISILKHE